MRLLFICLFFSFSASLFSQKIIRNADSSVSVTAAAMIYLDSSGNCLDIESFQDSLGSGRYDVSLKKQSAESMVVQLKEKDPVENNPDLQPGKEIPLPELCDINRNKKDIGDKTEYILLIFWDVTCKPCIEELTELNILADKYSNMIFMAITSTPAQNVHNFLQEKGLEWKNLTIIPDSRTYFNTLKICAVPLTIVIDKNRTIKKILAGKNVKAVHSYLENLGKAK